MVCELTPRHLKDDLKKYKSDQSAKVPIVLGNVVQFRFWKGAKESITNLSQWKSDNSNLIDWLLKGQYQQDVVGDLWWFSSDEYQHDGDDGIYAKLMIFKRMTIVISICDEYQQDGDRVVVKTVVTVSVGWD